jgi:integrase
VRHVGEDTFPTKADALAYLSTVETDLRRGSWIDPAASRRKFADLADQWLVSNPGKRSSTLQRDAAIVRNHLLPELGRAAIGSISRVRIQELVNTWASDCAARTARRQFDVLRAILAYAVATDALLRSPCNGVKLPAIEVPDRPPLTPDDVSRIAGATPEAYRAMVWIGAVLGLRWGEVAGLQLRALDFAGGTITVTAQLGRDGRLAPPKSAAGRRVLGAPAALFEILEAHLAHRPVTAKETDLVFTAPQGGPLDYTHWRRRVWLPATRAAGLPTIGFHDLRRTAATALLLEGVDVKTAQVRLGHSDPRLTIAVYAQATNEGDQNAAAKLGARFFPQFRECRSSHPSSLPTEARPQ